jgi:hypothetical protein
VLAVHFSGETFTSGVPVNKHAHVFIFYFLYCTQQRALKNKPVKNKLVKRKISNVALSDGGYFLSVYKNNQKLFLALSRKNIFSHNVFAANEENIQSRI